ncbi:MAG: hypothetical protein QXF01_01800 [Candidatus Micrarchaeaceae archaeon]
MANDNFREVAAKLLEDPSEKNWKEFSSALKRSKAKFYNIVFAKGKLSKKDDLREAFAEIYDSKERLLAKVPIFMKKGGGIEGTTIYLRGLLSLNK